MTTFKRIIKDICWITFSILLIVFVGTPLFIYSYKDKLTSKGFMRFLTLWLLVIILYLFNIINSLLF